MQAAVVHDFRSPPVYGPFADPEAGPGEVVISVRAAALSPLVKSQAAGTHYSSKGARLPLVPGVDGVGRRQDGRRVYFAFPRAPYGAMADLTVVPGEFCVDLPDELDDATAAAIANPGMSSWAALTERAGLAPGETVLVNGATGTSGRLAVQIARHLGAKTVLATGRNPQVLAELPSLGADAVISLEQPAEALAETLGEQLANGGVDVVLDYLWGSSAEQLIAALSNQRSRSRGQRVRFVQIGSSSGANLTLPAAALRSHALELLGSGLGSVSTERLLASVKGLLHAVGPAKLRIEAESVPLAEVQDRWNAPAKKRLVFTP